MITTPFYLVASLNITSSWKINKQKPSKMTASDQNLLSRN